MGVRMQQRQGKNGVILSKYGRLCRARLDDGRSFGALEPSAHTRHQPYGGSAGVGDVSGQSPMQFRLRVL